MIKDIFGQNIMIIIRNDSMEEDMLRNCKKLDYFCGLVQLFLLFSVDIAIIILVRFLRQIFFLEGFLPNGQVFINQESNRLLNIALLDQFLGSQRLIRYFSILMIGSFFLFRGLKAVNIERDHLNRLLAMFLSDYASIIFFYFELLHSGQQIPFSFFHVKTENLYLYHPYSKIECALDVNFVDQSCVQQHQHNAASIQVFLGFFIDWVAIVQSRSLFL